MNSFADSVPDLFPTPGSQSTKQLSYEELRQEADGLYAGIAYLNQTEQIEDNVVDVDDDDDEGKEEELAECSVVPEVRYHHLRALHSAQLTLKSPNLEAHIEDHVTKPASFYTKRTSKKFID